MRVVCVVAVAFFFGLSSGVSAQYSSDKPIRMLVPFAAGSGTDIAARLLAQSLSESIKRTVLIDNRPGALGTIATNAAAVEFSLRSSAFAVPAEQVIDKRLRTARKRSNRISS